MSAADQGRLSALPEVFETCWRSRRSTSRGRRSQPECTARDTHAFLASHPYLQQQPLSRLQVGFALRPRSLDDSGGSRPRESSRAVSTWTPFSALTTRYLPKLSWREIHAADSLELMQLVTDEKADLAIVDSIEFSIQQQLFPRESSLRYGNRRGRAGRLVSATICQQQSGLAGTG